MGRVRFKIRNRFIVRISVKNGFRIILVFRVRVSLPPAEISSSSFFIMLKIICFKLLMNLLFL